MEQKNLLTQALEFIQAQQRHRWWLRMMTGMAAVVVFLTTYLLILPAITMENSTFEVTATPSEAVLGEVIDSEIYTTNDNRSNTQTITKLEVKNADGTETISGDGDGFTFTATPATGTVATDVVNTTGLELPETGGMGTTIFYIVGGILVVGAGVLLITKKRMEK